MRFKYYDENGHTALIAIRHPNYSDILAIGDFKPGRSVYFGKDYSEFESLKTVERLDC
jgi:hypothetical protein